MKRLILAALFVTTPVFAQTGMVTSAEPAATAAGQEILRAGGSATDAAMAMMLALTVVEPQSSGIGGGGFLVHHDGKSGLIETIDGRETAPAAASSDRFLGADGQPLPFLKAFPGGKSVGVPGNVRLMALAEAKWGRLPWKALFGPAIKLAEDGFVANARLATTVTGVSPLWGNFAATADLYAHNGRPVTTGSLVKNPALAKMLRKLADDGPDAFYTGGNARALLDAATGSRVNPSDLTAADLTGYRAKQRPAVCGKYRSYTICGMGPPSSGATTVLGVLGMLERFDLKRLGPASPVAWHLIGEAMQLTYADRDKYMADRDFIDVPVAGLIDPAYLRSRARLISPRSTLGTYAAGNPPGAPVRTGAPSAEVPATTHFIAIDRGGDIVTMTSTVEGPFGSQLIANGYVLNNELTDFTFAPEKNGAPVANRVQGGKRPLSSMAPTIVYDATGKPVFVVGAAGGKTIPMQVTKTLIAHLDWGMGAQAAVAAPVIFFNADGLVLEGGTTLAALQGALEKLGHKVTINPSLPLKTNAAEKTATGWVGAADPRSLGNWASE